MAEPSSSTRRVIMAALMILPFGTVLLGILSFVFYFNQQEKASQRSLRFAATLQRDLNEADFKRHEQVFAEALALPHPERVKVLAAYLDSTLGPENMGYTVRTMADRAGADLPAVALEVEATGSKKAQDIVLVLGGFVPGLDSPDPGGIARPMAAMLGVAHALAGASKVRSIRFVAVQDLEGLKVYYRDAVGFRDRIQHVLLAGAAAQFSDERIQEALHLQGRGAVLVRPPLQSLADAEALKKQIEDLADRL